MAEGRHAEAIPPAELAERKPADSELKDDPGPPDGGVFWDFLAQRLMGHGDSDDTANLRHRARVFSSSEFGHGARFLDYEHYVVKSKTKKKSESKTELGILIPSSKAELGINITGVANLYPTRKSAAEAAGISTDQLARYMRGENEPSVTVAARLAAGADVPLDWIVKGIPGKAGHDEISDMSSRLHLRQHQAFKLAEHQSPYVTTLEIPQFDARASAGPGAFSDEDRIVGRITLDAAWIQAKVDVAPERLFAITAIGNSMHPTIEPGDLLVVERYAGHSFDGAIYVVMRAGAVIVKRLQTAGPRTIVLRGDNPTSREEVIGPDDPDETVIIGRVRIIARTL